MNTEKEFKSRGGAWLGAIRSWIQHNCINGSDVIWGSHEVLRTTRTFTPALMEEIAGEIAWKAVDEDRKAYARPAIFEMQHRDFKIKMLATRIINTKLFLTFGNIWECPYCHIRADNDNGTSCEIDNLNHLDDCVYVYAKKVLSEIKED